MAHGWKKTIHHFTGAPDGGQPHSGLVSDSVGNLYGVTEFGGTGMCRPSNTYGENEGCGTLYKLTLDPSGNWTETLFSFPRGGGLGIFPSSTLLLDKAGHLLGITLAGGDGIGTVFELDRSQERGWREVILHIFFGFPDDGAFPFPALPNNPPNPRLAMDTEGKLFGVTYYGGSHFDGTVFELQRAENGWTEKVIHHFAGGTDGSLPSAGLVLDSQGHFYGTTAQGGTGKCNGGCGTVYEVVP